MGKHITTVLLDIDGTLVDSNDAHAAAWVDAGREFGYDVAFDHVRGLIGMGGDKVLPKLTGLEEDSAEGKRILERRGEIFRSEYLPKLGAFDGARELLTRLRTDGYALVAATSASDEDLDALLGQAGLTGLIPAATTSDDAEESKPAPDIIEAALRKAGAQPEAAVLIGDTPYDVTAGRRAGVTVLALRSGGWQDEDLEAAAAIYDDVNDLLGHYSTSILGKK